MIYPDKRADISPRHHWFPREMTSEQASANSILMTRHYPDVGSVFDWLKQISLAAGSTNQKHYPDLGRDSSAVQSLRSLIWRHLARKPRGVFLEKIMTWNFTFLILTYNKLLCFNFRQKEKDSLVTYYMLGLWGVEKQCTILLLY